MTRIVELGAPSLTGKDANDLVAEEFATAKYPLEVVITNRMPRNVVFPEVEGLFLRHVGSATGNQQKVVIESHDQFQRLASSVEQIAELNSYEYALTIEEVTATEAVKPTKGKAAADPAAADPAAQ